jgi:hypothetical protein
MKKETMIQWRERVMEYSKEDNPYNLKQVPQPQEHCYSKPSNEAMKLNMLFKYIGEVIREETTRREYVEQY